MWLRPGLVDWVPSALVGLRALPLRWELCEGFESLTRPCSPQDQRARLLPT